MNSFQTLRNSNSFYCVLLSLFLCQVHNFKVHFCLQRNIIRICFFFFLFNSTQEPHWIIMGASTLLSSLNRCCEHTKRIQTKGNSKPQKKMSNDYICICCTKKAIYTNKQTYIELELRNSYEFHLCSISSGAIRVFPVRTDIDLFSDIFL